MDSRFISLKRLLHAARAPWSPGRCLFLAAALLSVSQTRAATVEPEEWNIGAIEAGKMVSRAFVITAGEGETINPRPLVYSDRQSIFLKANDPFPGKEGKKYSLELGFWARTPGKMQHYVLVSAGGQKPVTLRIRINGTVTTTASLFFTMRNAAVKRVLEIVKRLESEHPDAAVKVGVHPLEDPGNISRLTRYFQEYRIPRQLPPPLLLFLAGRIYLSESAITAALRNAFAGEELPPAEVRPPQPAYAVQFYVHASSKRSRQAVLGLIERLKRKHGETRLARVRFGMFDLGTPEVLADVARALQGKPVPAAPDGLCVALGPLGGEQPLRISAGGLDLLPQVEATVDRVLAGAPAAGAPAPNPPASEPGAREPTSPAEGKSPSPLVGGKSRPEAESSDNSALEVLTLLGVILLLAFNVMVFLWMKRIETRLGGQHRA